MLMFLGETLLSSLFPPEKRKKRMPNRRRKQSMTKCSIGDDLDKLETRDPGNPRGKPGSPTVVGKQITEFAYPVVVKDIIKGENGDPFIAALVAPAGLPDMDTFKVLLVKPAHPYPAVEVGSRIWLTIVRFGECVAYYIDH